MGVARCEVRLPGREMCSRVCAKVALLVNCASRGSLGPVNARDHGGTLP